jgi:hypothetical protein
MGRKAGRRDGDMTDSSGSAKRIEGEASRTSPQIKSLITSSKSKKAGEGVGVGDRGGEGKGGSRMRTEMVGEGERERGEAP